MLKGNIPLDADFFVPPKEPKSPKKKPTFPLKETPGKRPTFPVDLKQLGVKTANELVVNFEEGSPLKIDVGTGLEIEKDPPRIAIKNSPFDELFYRLTDDIRAGNNLMHLSFLERTYNLLQAMEAKSELAKDIFLGINQSMADNGF